MKEMIANPSRTKEIIQKYSFILQKKYGQNFLIDLHVLDKIIESAQITKDDFVLEIGPGIGSLTQQLAECAREVLAVEIDKNLIPILQDTLKDYSNITILNQDIMKVDLKQMIQEKNKGEKIKVVANLPYYITTPIIMGILESDCPIDSITVMIQKEVARRIQAGPGTKDYGALSLAVQYYAEPYLAANVPQHSFIPRPNVDSAVIKMTKYSKPPVTVKDEKMLFQIIRAAFGQRRKTLVNSLSNKLPLEKKQILDALHFMGLDPKIRGEALTLENFAKLTDLLYHE